MHPSYKRRCAQLVIRPTWLWIIHSLIRRGSQTPWRAGDGRPTTASASAGLFVRRVVRDGLVAVLALGVVRALAPERVEQKVEHEDLDQVLARDEEPPVFRLQVHADLVELREAHDRVAEEERVHDEEERADGRGPVHSLDPIRRVDLAHFEERLQHGLHAVRVHEHGRERAKREQTEHDVVVHHEPERVGLARREHGKADRLHREDDREHDEEEPQRVRADVAVREQPSQHVGPEHDDEHEDAVDEERAEQLDDLGRQEHLPAVVAHADVLRLHEHGHDAVGRREPEHARERREPHEQVEAERRRLARRRLVVHRERPEREEARAAVRHREHRVHLPELELQVDHWTCK